MLNISQDCMLTQFYSLKRINSSKGLSYKSSDGRTNIQVSGHSVTAIVECSNKVKITQSFNTFSTLLRFLDKYNTCTASLYMMDSTSKQQIIAAISARDISSKLVRVKSSNLWAYGMNVNNAKDRTGSLCIQFKGKRGGPGDIYMYYDVPIKVWQRFLAAPSAGHFFWINIRNVYKYAKLTGDRKTHLPNGVN